MAGIITAAGLQIGFIVILLLAARLEPSESQIETPAQKEARRSNPIAFGGGTRGR